MMIKAISVMCFFLVLSLPTKAVLIGEIDIQRVLLNVKQGKNIRAELQKEFDKKDKILKAEESGIEKLQKDFEKLRENFSKQRLVMSDKKRAEQEGVLQEKGMALQQKMIQFQQKTNTYQEDIRKLESEKKAPVLKRIRGVVKAVSQKEGVDFTYETSMAPMVYAKNSKNLTDSVIKEYDKKYK